MSEVKYREFWIYPDHTGTLTVFGKPLPNEFVLKAHVIEYSALAAKDAEIEQLKKRISWLESGSIHTCHAECEKPLCVANREIERLKEVNVVSSKYWIEKESALLSKINDWESKIQQLENKDKDSVLESMHIDDCEWCKIIGEL